MSFMPDLAISLAALKLAKAIASDLHGTVSPCTDSWCAIVLQESEADFDER
ncbi:MAG TPA: hypothetical protein VJ251_05250 [Stellaceae bacterium]|jgi:hypothetical protein|nr:hypothetical protein [Stellaceae bacterium]